MIPPTNHADKPHKRALDGDSPTGSTGRLADRFQTLPRLSSEALGDKEDEEDDAQAHKRRKVEETGEAEPRWVPQRSNVQNCDGCRSRKTKCDRSRPCGNCRLRGKACTYSHSQLDPLNSSRLDKNFADTIRLKQHAFMLARRLGISQVELEDLSRLADRLFDDEAKRTLPKGMWLPSKRPLVEVLRTRDAARRVTVTTGAPPSSSPPVPSAHGPPRAPPPSSRPAPPPPPPAPPRYHGYDVAASWSSLQQAQQDELAPQPVDRPESSSPPPRPHNDGDDSAFTSVPLKHAPRLFGARASTMSSSSTASGLVGSAPGPPTWASVAQPPPPRPPPSLPPHKPFSLSLASSMTPAQRASTPTLPPLAIPALAYRSMHLSSAVTTLSSAYSPLRTASTASTTPASAAPSASACDDGDAASNLPPPFRLSPPRSTSSRSPSPPSTAPKVSRPRLAGFASLSAIAGLDSPSSRGEGPSGDDRRSSVLPPLRLLSMLHGEQ
ncbi:hypothetical protein JCM9279_005721 [Rhodotorula babjevae]